MSTANENTVTMNDFIPEWETDRQMWTEIGLVIALAKLFAPESMPSLNAILQANNLSSVS